MREEEKGVEWLYSIISMKFMKDEEINKMKNEIYSRNGHFVHHQNLKYK